MDLGETRVLGNWQPSRLDVETLADEFPEEVKRLLGVNLRASAGPVDFRGPTQQSSPDFGYHRDCQGKFDEYIVVWSNLRPTLVRTSKGILKARNGDIILIENKKHMHCTPEGSQDGDRWFARVRIKD